MSKMIKDARDAAGNQAWICVPEPGISVVTHFLPRQIVSFSYLWGKGPQVTLLNEVNGKIKEQGYCADQCLSLGKLTKIISIW
jgi:hypothetical protein